ncbi:helix-turn-helix domain-containing protein [Alkaliphilus hydrothermalis]|uniref:Tetratricopeptide (TPR) repeat protein n=1 Tax=Alkaliphilus hydrothermalis TaxID=1482730 RepID=A0ABS2NN13_9FIRM|nr:helix-turn-helix transcriptional regulator [Alkaliphilus hydrothermalis]MBM7614323.1 tetratricopeptide (TPR) repeat protein [Alkaliphilus hydrothermalis]
MKKVLSAGEKIKKLRLELGLKQADLTSEAVSKSLISMIEKGKRSLTLQTAEIIAEVLNRYYKNMDMEITPEFLMETERDQIKADIAKDLDHLKRAINSRRADEVLVNNTFEKVIDLTQKWKFKEEYMELKILRGNFYYDNYQYKEAVEDYLDVMNYSIREQNYGQIARIYNLLGRTYQMQMMMDSAIVHYVKAFDTAMYHSTTNKDRIKTEALLNQIICYKNIKRYDLALAHVRLFKNLNWEDPLFNIYKNRVTLIEANTYRDLENWKKAEEVYQTLIPEARRLDDETLFLLYENYALLHRNQGNKEIALDYLQKAFYLKDDVNLNYLPALYLYQATCYNLTEEYENVLICLERGLKLAKMVSQKHLMIELQFTFVELFIKLEDYETALQQLKEVDKTVQELAVKSLLNDLYSYYIDVYTGLGEGNIAKEYTSKIRQKNYLRD